MTHRQTDLAELMEKGSDADLLRKMMTFVVNRMMDLDVESLVPSSGEPMMRPQIARILFLGSTALAAQTVIICALGQATSGRLPHHWIQINL